MVEALSLNRLPTAIFDVAGRRLAGTHLPGKFHNLQHANQRLRTIKFLVGLAGQESCRVIPLDVRELPEGRAAPVPTNRLRIEVHGFQAGRLGLFLDGHPSRKDRPVAEDQHSNKHQSDHDGAPGSFSTS